MGLSDSACYAMMKIRNLWNNGKYMSEAVLQNKNWMGRFLLIAVGQTVSLIGSSAVQFALIWWLASETGSPLMMSFASLAAFVPQMLLGPFAGVWIDRLKRKNIIISADLFQGAVALAFAFFFISGTPPFWSVFVVLGIRAIGGVFHTPAIQSAIPMLVPQDQLMRANSWSQFMQSGAFMLGPVLGAAMYAALPLWIILLSDLVGAVAACITVAAVKIPDPPRTDEAPHFFRELKEGAIAFLRDKKLTITAAASVLTMVFFMPVGSFYPLMTSDHFNATAWHAGVVEFVYAGGMMACALALSWFKPKNKFRVIHIALVGMGTTILLCGILPPTMTAFWIFVVLCGLMGASGNLYNIPFVAYIQETMPYEAMGRVFSLIGSVSSIAMPLGLIIAGPVAEKYGIALWFVIAGVVMIAIATTSAVFVLPHNKQSVLKPTMPDETDAMQQCSDNGELK